MTQPVGALWKWLQMMGEIRSLRITFLSMAFLFSFLSWESHLISTSWGWWKLSVTAHTLICCDLWARASEIQPWCPPWIKLGEGCWQEQTPGGKVRQEHTQHKWDTSQRRSAGSCSVGEETREGTVARPESRLLSAQVSLYCIELGLCVALSTKPAN